MKLLIILIKDMVKDRSTFRAYVHFDLLMHKYKEFGKKSETNRKQSKDLFFPIVYNIKDFEVPKKIMVKYSAMKQSI